MSDIKGIRYVLGFAFSKSMRSVVLIEKKKPEWQAGLLNGIGGKLEEGESAAAAMVREFKEETGVWTTEFSWLPFEMMHFKNGVTVFCFATLLPVGQVVNTMEDEIVDVFPVNSLGELQSEVGVIPNLHWLIPKAWHELKLPDAERML